MAEATKNKSTKLSLLATIVAFGLGYYTHYFRTARNKPAGRPQVAFVAGGSNAFWKKATEGARDAARLLDADVQIFVPENGLAEQNQILASLPVNRISGVSISPMSPDEQSVVLGRIADKINLITHDSDAPKSGPSVTLVPINFEQEAFVRIWLRKPYQTAERWPFLWVACERTMLNCAAWV